MHVIACRNTEIRVVLAQAKVALLDILGVAGGWAALEFPALKSVMKPGPVLCSLLLIGLLSASKLGEG